jgi:hypothetical protein
VHEEWGRQFHDEGGEDVSKQNRRRMRLKNVLGREPWQRQHDVGCAQEDNIAEIIHEAAQPEGQQIPQRLSHNNFVLCTLSGMVGRVPLIRFRYGVREAAESLTPLFRSDRPEVSAAVEHTLEVVSKALSPNSSAVRSTASELPQRFRRSKVPDAEVLFINVAPLDGTLTRAVWRSSLATRNVVNPHNCTNRQIFEFVGFVEPLTPTPPSPRS